MSVKCNTHKEVQKKIFSCRHTSEITLILHVLKLIFTAGERLEPCLTAFKEVLFFCHLTVTYCDLMMVGKGAEMSFLVSELNLKEKPGDRRLL
jgi:hypothetical protein